MNSLTKYAKYRILQDKGEVRIDNQDDVIALELFVRYPKENRIYVTPYAITVEEALDNLYLIMDHHLWQAVLKVEKEA